MVGKKVRKVVVTGHVGTEACRKKHEETFCGDGNSSCLARSLIAQVHAYMITCFGKVHLKYIQFTVCKFYFKNNC